MARKNTDTKRLVEAYEHRDKERVNNPPVGLVTPDTDPDAGEKKKTYTYDPHLAPELNLDGRKARDELAVAIERGLAAQTLEEAKAVLSKLKEAQEPFLNWAGKAEHTSFEVPTVSLHVHERIEPRTIIESVRKRNGQRVQISLFEEERKEPLRNAIEFYQHKHGWTNRLIAGDSLLVMNSLLEKEGMAGKVQMIYFDPPYGIRYGSNFQPFVNKRDVKDGKDEDLTAEPEQIKAFRDTWELGIHSYLTYLRDRLLLARELLTESGSIFVQMNSENAHLVTCLLDEVFGSENFVANIVFRKKSLPLGAKHLETMHDHILFYAKDKKHLKYRHLFEESDVSIIASHGPYALYPDGSYARIEMTDFRSKSHPSGTRYYRLFSTIAPSYSSQTDFRYDFQGISYPPPSGGAWVVEKSKLDRLASVKRLQVEGSSLSYRLFFEDFPYKKITNFWLETAMSYEKVYVVQTTPDVIARCLLMTTDPGDLVFDPTCGSGTTAYVAEQWGRRWITCDTSRVAIAVARQRLMTAVFNYYELSHPDEGVGSGFKYKTVPHVKLEYIANNPEIDGIYARMHPVVEQALADLNNKLKGTPVKFEVERGGREGHLADFSAPDTATFTMPSGQVIKVNELVEWEVPFKFPADWSEAARAPFERFHAVRQAMQKAMDEAIMRHAPQETLYDQPFVDRKKVRVTGPFTVEAVPAPAVKSLDEILEPKPEPADISITRSGETLRQTEWRDELLRTGIRGKAGQYIRFSRLEPLPGCRWLHAEGETRPSDEGADRVREHAPAYNPMRVVVSFGPEHAPMEQRHVAHAIEEAQTLVPKPRLIVFAAFQFDPEAAKDIDEIKWPGVTLLKAQMNADLLTDDLKKKRASNESFWLIGQPDVELERITEGEGKGKLRVIVHGFDYYNTKTGGIESGGADKIAVWMLDTDYDGRSLYPRQVFFPMAADNKGWARLAKSLKTEVDEDRIEAYRGTVSLPFDVGEHKRIAVKIVDDRGIESLRVMGVE